MPLQSAHSRLAAIPIALLLLGYLLLAIFSDSDPLSPMINADAVKYWNVAGTVADQGIYAERKHFLGEDRYIDLRSWRPPFTSLFMAPFRYLNLTPEQMRIVYWALLGATAFLLWGAAAELLPPDARGYSWAAAIAPLLYLVHLQTFRAASALSAEVPFMFLFSGCLWLLLVATRQPHRQWQLALLLAAGLVCGMAFLSRTVLIAAMPGILGLLAVRQSAPGQLTDKCLSLATFVLGIAVIVGGWQLRNAQFHDNFVFIASSSGYNLFKATVFDGSIDSSTAILKRKSEVLDTYSESAGSQILTQEAIDFALADLDRMAARTADKALQLWSPREGLQTFSTRWWYTAIMQGFLVAVSLLALFRGPRRSYAFWLLVICAGFTALHSVTLVGPRFVMPVLLPCYLLAGIMAAVSLATLANRRE